MVPNPKLLPQGSIQFFSVDPYWVQILLRGAFAIGDIASADVGIEDNLFENIPSAVQLSGFLLRSPVVSGWPDLLVDGFDTVSENEALLFETGTEALVQHVYKLGPDTLLCLFEGAIKSVEIYLHAEMIHYGVDFNAKDPGDHIPEDCYIKYLRDPQGNLPPPDTKPCSTETGKDYEVGKWVRIPFRFADSGVIDVGILSERFLLAVVPAPTAVTAAEFCYQMIEGVPKVRFRMDNQY